MKRPSLLSPRQHELALSLLFFAACAVLLMLS